MISSNRRRLPAFTLMIAAICMFCAASADAQGQGQGQGQGRGARGQGQSRMMGPALIDRMHAAVNELGLTDEQKPKVDEIFTKAKDDFAKMEPELRDLPMQDRGTRVREFMQKLVGDVKAVLTDEQKTKFDQRVAELQSQRGGGQGAGQGGQMRRMREAAASLDLSPEQKTKVDEILSKAEKAAEQARQESQGDREAMQEKARAIAQDTIAQLEQVLTPEQAKQFRESVRAARGSGNGDGRGRRRGDSPSTQPSDTGANPPSTQPAKDGKPGAMLIPDANSPGAPPGALGRLEVGQVAPDFLIKKLDGTPVQLSSFKGKTFLLAFGSYTSPSFRQRVGALDELRREYGARVGFVMVYTREAHPAGTWEVDRNRAEEISIGDHKNETDRRNAAKLARDRLRLGSFTITTDSMDNATATAYHAFPNAAAVLISREGTVLAYEQWFDPYIMRDAIVDALAGKSTADNSR